MENVTEQAPKEVTAFFELVERYSAFKKVKLSTVSRNLFGDARTIERMRDGNASCRLDKYLAAKKLMQDEMAAG